MPHSGPPRQAVWLREEGRPRKPRLTRERIVGSAVALLDAQGVDGFSMRRLAARLNAGTMSLYAYVATKEDVLDLALDEAIAEIELEELEGAPWRTIVTRQLTQTRAVMRRHPWVPELIGTRPLLGPNTLARSERVYAALVRAGLGGPGLLAAVSVLSFYASGFAAAENVWRTWVQDTADESDLRQQAKAHIAERADRYPTLTEHAQLDYDDFDAGYALGVKIILDGIEAQIAQGAAGDA